MFLHLKLVLGLLLLEAVNGLVNISPQIVVLFNFGDSLLLLTIQVIINGGHFVLTLISQFLAIGTLFIHGRFMLQVKIVVLLEHGVAQAGQHVFRLQVFGSLLLHIFRVVF